MPFWNRNKKEASKPAGPETRHGRPPTGYHSVSAPGLSQVRNVIAVASGKGGVGKSTVAVNLALALKTLGYEVGLMDADIYGPSQPGMLGAQKERLASDGHSLDPAVRYGIHYISMGLLMGEDAPVVWRAPMATKMMVQFIANVNWGNLDYLIIDLPPGTGDVQLTLAQQASLTGAIIVTTPQQVALGIAQKGLKMFEQVKVPILGIVENMSGFLCQHCGKETDIFKEGGGKALAKKLKVPFLGAIQLDREIMESGDSGQPVLLKSSDSNASKCFLNLANQLNDELEKLGLSTDLPSEIGTTPAGQLKIDWASGESQSIDPYQLRLECHCAVCVDENTGQRKLDPKSVPLDIRLTHIEKVGRYGLAPRFSDGHTSGIYTFEHLRKMEQPQQKGFEV